MTPHDYLDRLLLRYSGTFDIYKPYQIGDRKYPAYGYFILHMEKYVLVREANMWSCDSYEHILFVEALELTDREIGEGIALIRDYMEPKLVRKGREVPEKNHMCSYLTVVFLAAKAIGRKEVVRIRRFFFDKGYRFGTRGYSQGRLIAVDLEREKVYVNRSARKAKKLYQEIFREVRSGKPGYEEEHGTSMERDSNRREEGLL